MVPIASFPRLCRLLKTDEFSSVFGFRKSLKSRHFLLHYRLREAVEGTERAHGAVDNGPRLGLVIAKRILRRSVDRNLIRRLAREAFRTQRQHLPPYDCVLRLGAKPEALDKKALAAEIHGLLARLSNCQTSHLERP